MSEQKFCRTCRHWRHWTADDISLLGECACGRSVNLSPVYVNSLAWAEDTNCEKANLVTRPAFGCTQWSGKEEKTRELPPLTDAMLVKLTDRIRRLYACPWEDIARLAYDAVRAMVSEAQDCGEHNE